MRISSSLLARQPTELLRFRNAELWTQTITTQVGQWVPFPRNADHEDASDSRPM